MSLLTVLGLPPSRFSGARNAPSEATPGANTPGHGPKILELSEASGAWRQAHRQANDRIAALKASVRSHYAGDHPEILKQIEEGLATLDTVLNKVDQRLADSLANASKAGDDSARQAELKNAKSILTEYIGHIKGDPLIAHMDQNPFHVKTDLKALLIGGLTDAAKAIG